MSVADDVKEIFTKMPGAFLPEKAANTNATIQIELTGEGGGNWVLKVANGKIAINEGSAVSPDLTLAMAAADYIALSRSEANPISLFMAGRIKAEGDMSLALKFQEMFQRD